jgi:3-oxoacyl-[acyl-carrier-protein] synthase II
MSHRVFITGLGVVSPIGIGVEAYWDALLHRERPLRDARDTQPSHMALRRTHNVDDLPAASDSTTTGHVNEFALTAAKIALEDAGIADLSPFASRTGVAIGNAMGNDVLEARRFRGEDYQLEDRFAFDVAARLGNSLGARGPNLSVSTACSAGLYAIASATMLIRGGSIERMIVGGAEATSRVAMGCFNRLAAFDPVACRPFSADRKGTLMGEGAAVLLLESEAAAIARGSRVYGVIDGFGWSCDAHHATIPEPSASGAIAAAGAALRDSRIDASSIDAVLAHGTGTEQNDLVESRMLEEVFGSGAATLPVTAIKSKLGHSGGAAGAFQCLTAALMIRDGLVPPTSHGSNLDRRCRIELVRERPLAKNLRHVLMNSYAFGGNNISLIVGKEQRS